MPGEGRQNSSHRLTWLVDGEALSADLAIAIGVDVIGDERLKPQYPPTMEGFQACRRVG